MLATAMGVTRFSRSPPRLPEFIVGNHGDRCPIRRLGVVPPTIEHRSPTYPFPIPSRLLLRQRSPDRFSHERSAVIDFDRRIR